MNTIIRIITCTPVMSLIIGLIIYEAILKPIKTHSIQKELMSKGYPKPNNFKKYIWF